MSEVILDQVHPIKFLDHSYTLAFEADFSRQKIWNWLNKMDTFTEGQIWPYRVEFVDPHGAAPRFESGVFTNHHGPLMNFAGVIGEMRDFEYRDLKYFYGSYFLSFRWIRPYRLEFWLDEVGSEKTKVTLKVSSYVAPSWDGRWTWMQTHFWKRFPRWMNKELRT